MSSPSFIIVLSYKILFENLTTLIFMRTVIDWLIGCTSTQLQPTVSMAVSVIPSGSTNAVTKKSKLKYCKPKQNDLTATRHLHITGLENHTNEKILYDALTMILHSCKCSGIVENIEISPGRRFAFVSFQVINFFFL